MNESAFPEAIVTETESASVVSLLTAEDAVSFSQLVEIIRLVPASDFRHADLRGVDLSNSDLRGYDFTGSDLRGAGGTNIIFDSTTITDNADTDGSIFATRNRLTRKSKENPDIERIARGLRKEEWADQLIWCFKNFHPNGKYNDIATDVATAIYQTSQSQYAKSQLIPFIIKSLPKHDQFNFLLSTISQDNDTIISRLSLEQLFLMKFGHHQAAQTAAFRLMSSNRPQTQLSAIKLLVRFPGSNETYEHVSKIVTGHRFLEAAYVSEVASSISKEYQLVTRDPHTNESFGINEKIEKLRLRRIALRWLRIEYELKSGNERSSILDMPSATINFQYDELVSRETLICDMWNSLDVYGIHIHQI